MPPARVIVNRIVHAIPRRLLPSGSVPRSKNFSPLPLRFLRILRLALHLARGLAKLVSGSSRWTAARRAREIRRWSRELLALLAIRLDAAHPPPLDGTGAMFVLNHVSWLDIFVLDAVLPVTFVAKSEIGRWPLVGTLVTRAGTLYIERGSKSAARRTSERLAQALREGTPVAIFPEGTTSWGESVQRFHTALFQPAVDTGATVRPAVLRYFDRDGQPTRAAAYVGDDSLIKSIWMIVSEPKLSVRLEFLAPIPAAGAERRALAEQARAQIVEGLDRLGTADERR